MWDWEEAWERLPAGAKENVATIEITALEAAMHQATSTQRFCVDCKENVVTALDVLTERVREEDLENGEELNRGIFRPFVGRIFAPAAERGEGEERGEEAVSAAGGKSRTPLVSSASGNNEGRLLCCAVGDVEDLIKWAEVRREGRREWEKRGGGWGGEFCHGLSGPRFCFHLSTCMTC